MPRWVLTTETKFDVIIIGAGAAGLMSALTAGKRGRHVLLLDHAKRIGKKILMSGGGHCNFTNHDVTPQNYLSNNPHFAKSALARYTPADFISLVEKYRIPYHEKELGQLFCDGSSKQIVALLEHECTLGGVRIRNDCQITEVAHHSPGFRVATSLGDFTGTSLIIATGGLSIPTMGASGFGYQLARQFGHSIQPTRPGLVPMTLSGTHLEYFAGLSGVSLHTAETATAKRRFRAGLLFTHRGLSGPSILQISSYWLSGTPLSVNFLPEESAEPWLLAAKKTHSQIELKNVLAERLPKSLAHRLCEQSFSSRAIGSYSDKALTQIAAQLHAWPIIPSGTEGYRKAEVTVGGVDTHDLSSTTMESKRIPGLYFVGEVLDVTGWLGGYNFQWAWASGYAAGQHA